MFVCGSVLFTRLQGAELRKENRGKMLSVVRFRNKESFVKCDSDSDQIHDH